MPGASKLATSAKSTHPKSLAWDAVAIQGFEASAKEGSLGVMIRLVVKHDKARRESGAQARGVIRLLRALRAGRRPCGKRRTKPYPRLSDERRYTTKRKHRTCPAWRSTTDFLKAYFAHWVLAIENEPRAFTLNLGGDVEKQARAKDAEASRWLSQRLNYHLEAALDRPVRYWFRLELTDGASPYLHLHGELSCSDVELGAVRKALRKAGGAWAGLTGKQTKISCNRPDTGWVSYVMKHDTVHLQQAHSVRQGAAHKPSWRDDRFFIAQDLSRPTKEFYETLRKMVHIKTRPKRKRA